MRICITHLHSLALQYCASDQIEQLSRKKQKRTVCTENDFNQIFNTLIENMILYLAGLKNEMNIKPNPGDRCILTGHQVNYGIDLLAPCLMEAGKALPRLKAPPVARHMILDLPSEEVLAGEFNSIKGFEKGLYALTGLKTSTMNQALNSAMGYDLQILKCIRKTGMIFLHCADMSKMRFSCLQENIWCAGIPATKKQVGVSSGILYLADPEILVSVVMKSGFYRQRSEAIRGFGYLSRASGLRYKLSAHGQCQNTEYLCPVRIFTYSGKRHG